MPSVGCAALLHTRSSKSIRAIFCILRTSCAPSILFVLCPSRSLRLCAKQIFLCILPLLSFPRRRRIQGKAHDHRSSVLPMLTKSPSGAVACAPLLHTQFFLAHDVGWATCYPRGSLGGTVRLVCPCSSSLVLRLSSLPIPPAAGKAKNASLTPPSPHKHAGPFNATNSPPSPPNPVVNP